MAELYCNRGCALSSTERKAQVRLWHKAGVLPQLRAILQTHGAVTDGYTFPGFTLAGFHSKYDIADAKALGIRDISPNVEPSYHGLTTSFGNEPPRNFYSWNGVYYH